RGPALIYRPTRFALHPVLLLVLPRVQAQARARAGARTHSLEKKTSLGAKLNSLGCGELGPLRNQKALKCRGPINPHCPLEKGAESKPREFVPPNIIFGVSTWAVFQVEYREWEEYSKPTPVRINGDTISNK
ncbi:hypothetical protein H8959_000276, partial [Pygathrix nigripes]